MTLTAVGAYLRQLLQVRLQHSPQFFLMPHCPFHPFLPRPLQLSSVPLGHLGELRLGRRQEGFAVGCVGGEQGLAGFFEGFLAVGEGGLGLGVERGLLGGEGLFDDLQGVEGMVGVEREESERVSGVGWVRVEVEEGQTKHPPTCSCSVCRSSTVALCSARIFFTSARALSVSADRALSCCTRCVSSASRWSFPIRSISSLVADEYRSLCSDLVSFRAARSSMWCALRSSLRA